MPHPTALGRLAVRPPGVAADADFAGWFARLADRLLNDCDLLVAGRPYRVAELEAYYHGPAHPDPFAHRDPVQLLAGRWYFHRTRGRFRGGSFKGLDLTLGDGTATCGVLVRTILDPDGTAIDGPSRIVDHILSRTGFRSVAALNDAIGTRHVWEESLPVAVRESASPRTASVYQTARVGLSLKHGKDDPIRLRYVLRPYRFLSEPRAIRKGRPHLVLALHQQGHTAAAIRQCTGVPRRTIDAYVREFEAGKAVVGCDEYCGKDFSAAELCRLHGTWAVAFGPPVREVGGQHHCPDTPGG